MRLTAHRSLAISLALAAMMLRALLPDGWMPATGADAALSPFVICSIDGHHSGKGGDTKDGERTHGPCAFAAAGHLSPPATPASVLRAVGEAAHLAAGFADEDIFPAADYRPNAARAPPASA